MIIFLYPLTLPSPPEERVNILGFKIPLPLMGEGGDGGDTSPLIL